MNTPSSTIQAAGIYGAITTVALIVLAVISPELYGRIPPGGTEGLVLASSTIGGYFKKEKVLGNSK
ncbi:MAG: hypothetical protein ACW99G_22980 [Candidatus Thorarchaeota archaeon]|jgi:hypothetical protein